jgi:hypothetical protein
MDSQQPKESWLFPKDEVGIRGGSGLCLHLTPTAVFIAWFSICTMEGTTATTIMGVTFPELREKAPAKPKHLVLQMVRCPRLPFSTLKDVVKNLAD